MTTFPVTLACDLAETSETLPWLIEDLWADQAVGILGGPPKCCKSFLALDMAVSVASGKPCLRHFPVRSTGRVLLFPAEDSSAIVRRRLDGICRAAGTELAELDIHVITAPRVLLDSSRDRNRLSQTIEHLHPTLLILDPFIRLHRIDENASCEVAPLLAYLRELQRRFRMAIVLVHHTRKNVGRYRPGQTLRGSSDLHGWGDSNLYLGRIGDILTLTTEHRGAPSQDAIRLHLAGDDPAPSLAVLDTCASDEVAEEMKPSPSHRVNEALAGRDDPTSFHSLRRLCRMRAATLSATLNDMVDQGFVMHTTDGYALIAGTSPVSVSHSL